MTQQTAGRLLIVENEEYDLKQLEDLFAPYFTVNGIKGIRPAVVIKAVNEAEAFYPHIAIVDKRLTENDPLYDEDETGKQIILELKKKCPTIQCVINTAYPRTKFDRWAIEHDTIPFEKNESPEDKINKLLELIRKMCASYGGIQLEQGDAPSSENIKKILGFGRKVPSDLAYDLLIQLFSFAKSNQIKYTHKIQLAKMEKSISSPGTISRGRSVVMKVRRNDKPSLFIVKLAPHSKISTEVSNFEEFIQGEIIGEHYGQILETAQFWDLGVILYNLVGGLGTFLENFSDAYQTSDVKTLQQLLDYFFDHIWKKFYFITREWTSSLYDLYHRTFSTDHEKYSTRLIAYAKRCNSVKITDELEFENPIQWILRHKGDSRIIDILPFHEAVTHGDLHGDNILVDATYSQAWIIDYERTGWGHILRDFIELEIDTVIRMMPSACDLSHFLGLCTTLMLPNNAGDKYPDSENLIKNEHTAKAFEIIMRIRQQAIDHAHFTDYREYYWGLLLNAAYVATQKTSSQKEIKGEDLKKLQKERALVYGAVIYTRLENWGKSWPTKEIRNNLKKKAII